MSYIWVIDKRNIKNHKWMFLVLVEDIKDKLKLFNSTHDFEPKSMWGYIHKERDQPHPQ